MLKKNLRSTITLVLFFSTFTINIYSTELKELQKKKKGIKKKIKKINIFEKTEEYKNNKMLTAKLKEHKALEKQLKKLNILEQKLKNPNNKKRVKHKNTEGDKKIRRKKKKRRVKSKPYLSPPNNDYYSEIIHIEEKPRSKSSEELSNECEAQKNKTCMDYINNMLSKTSKNRLEVIQITENNRSQQRPHNIENRNNPKYPIREPRISEELASIVHKTCPEQIKKLITLYTKKTNKPYSTNAIILYGPNGTSKSTITEMIAKTTNRKILFIHAGSLGNTYKNSIAVNLKTALSPLKKEKAPPCVVVIDEFDHLLRKRNGTKEMDCADTIIAGELDDFKDNHKVIFIFTTNNLNEIEGKFLDRSKKLIKVPLPILENRKKIIKYFIDIDPTIKVDEYLQSHITKKTKNFSIRMLKHLIELADEDAIIKKENNDNEITILTKENFDEAFEDIQNTKKAKNNLWRKKKKKTFRKWLAPIGTTMGVITGLTGIYFAIKNRQQNYNLAKKSLQLGLKSYNLSKKSSLLGLGLNATNTIGSFAMPLLGKLFKK